MINDTQLDDIAKLARIELDDSIRQKTMDSVNNLLGLVEKMQAINLDDITPMFHPLEQPQRLRDDYENPLLNHSQSSLQSVAPNIEKGFYLVPKVVD